MDTNDISKKLYSHVIIRHFNDSLDSKITDPLSSYLLSGLGWHKNVNNALDDLIAYERSLVEFFSGTNIRFYYEPDCNQNS